MKVEFISFEDKRKIAFALSDAKVDDKICEFIFNEMQRLEGIIRDYEIGIGQIIDKSESKTFKTPKKLDITD